MLTGLLFSIKKLLRMKTSKIAQEEYMPELKKQADLFPRLLALDMNETLKHLVRLHSNRSKSENGMFCPFLRNASTSHTSLTQ